MDGTSSRKKAWRLTDSAFDKLLAGLDADKQVAAEKYQRLHRKLTMFFEVHRSSTAEDLADETVNRVTRRLEEGVAINSVAGYCLGVARMLLMETRSAQIRRQELDREIASSEPEAKDSIASDAQIECMESCLGKLPADNRKLIVEYHDFEKHAKIEHRKAMAERLGIPMNALRIRAHRIREQLESCVNTCLEKP